MIGIFIDMTVEMTFCRRVHAETGINRNTLALSCVMQGISLHLRVVLCTYSVITVCLCRVGVMCVFCERPVVM